MTENNGQNTWRYGVCLFPN